MSELRKKLSPTTARYGGAVLAVTVATVLRLLFNPILGFRLPFLAYVITIILVACYAGFGPALLSIALSAVLGTYLFITPTNSLFVADSSGVLQLVSFSVLSLVVSAFIKVIQD